MIGTAASSRPASALEMRTSAWPSSTQGMPISRTAKMAAGRQWRRAGLSAPVCRANGRSTTSASAVRPSTMAAGGTSATVILMKR